MKNPIYLVFFLFFIACKEQTIQEKFKQHISYLASDELEGREAGTDAEKKAAQYVATEFKNIGLEPKGTDGFFQEFDFIMGKTFGENSVTFEDSNLAIDKDFYPLNYSANGSASGNIVNAGFGIEASDVGYNDYEDLGDITGKVVQFSVSSPDGIHPHSKYLDYHNVRSRVKNAESKGAIAVILINDDENASDPKKDYTEKMARVGIPVIFVINKEKLTGENVSIVVEMNEDERIAKNVIGFIDNESDNIVVFGAHFDHLGYGKNGGSLYRGDEDMIHNGADDNASGTSMLIELSRAIKNSELNNSNYLFIAFSGEEKGLLGANYYTKNATIDLTTVNYMINMDMVGRLDSADYKLAINGVGTSPSWEILESLVEPPLSIVTSESGVGPSDHTSFYLSDIPVLHFFTGTHENYHKPSDDEPLINYEGMEMVYNYIVKITNALNSSEKLAFTKTKDSDSRSAPRFNVTLGIVPDYMYNETGVRVDGVSDGKPASVAGIQKGDIVLQLGDYAIDDLYGYMEALSKIKKGDLLKASVKRGDVSLTLDVQF